MLLKKRKQANMIGQLKNASAKLAKVQAGQIQVSDDYGPNMTYGRNIHPWSNKDQRKDVMLEFFPRDKTCSRWMARMELEDARFEQNFGSKGWISRCESAPMFLIDSS